MAARPRIHFHTKVLVPTVLVMALLQGVLMWVVYQRFTREFHNQAHRSLQSARMLFEHFEDTRTRDSQEKYRTFSRQPRVASICLRGALANEDGATAADKQTALKTLEQFLSDQVIPQLQVDFAAYTPTNKTLFAVIGRETQLQFSAVSSNIAASVQAAFSGPRDGVDTRDTVRIGDRLFDIASVAVAGVDGEALGVLTFGTGIKETVANEIKEASNSEIVFFSGGRVAVSTIHDQALYSELSQRFKESVSANSPGDLDIDLRNERFLSSAGRFRSLSYDPNSGYLLLYSLEKPLQELYATQRMLFTVGIFAILFGGLTIWLLVRTLTEPLRELRDGAEAVGRGDFQHQVEVDSNDECGELAETFNQMTANLRKSHADLEKTVESLKNTQAQLVQREKLSAIGEFVAGVTHELNNPLTVVIGVAELLRQIDPNEKHRKHLDTIVAGAQRCHKIVRSLLSFARQHPSERKLVNVNDLVEATLTFMQYEMRTSNIEIQRQLASDLPPVFADPHQLQQVFLNIVNNARQAMEPRHSGVLQVRSERTDSRVRITFTDNGPGIAPENLPKIFTPFFTTKEVGKGTGLGLSVSYGIIQDHGGAIHLESAVGKGTSFIIELPLGSADASPEQKNEFSRRSLSMDGVGKRVLAIDDEETILELIRETLMTNGYSVDVARDGEAALEHLHRNRYDVTLCDWKMPGLNGQQIYNRLLESNPSAAAHVVFMTGDVVNETIREFFTRHNATCIAKPFSLEEFREVVAKMSRDAKG